MSTQDVVTKMIIPSTAEKKVRYTDLLPSKVVSTPIYFVSHVWSEPFLDMIESVKYHVNDPAEDVFIWLDIFAVNQHRGTSDQTNDLQGKNIVF